MTAQRHHVKRQSMSSIALENESEEAIDRFAETAREFCSWLEGEPSDDMSERFTALRFLSRLYDQALQLPEIRDEHMAGAASEWSEMSAELTDRVMKRLDRFPTRSYWRIDRTSESEVEKVEDDVARDLFLTYSGVKDSLTDFDRGNQSRYRAAWSWRFTFWLDWGRHSTNAIQALHAQFHDEANRHE